VSDEDDVAEVEVAADAEDVVGVAVERRVAPGVVLDPRSARPDASGSNADNPRRTQAGEQAGRVCDSTAYLYRTPGKTFVGTVFKGQPLSILRRDDSGQWARVVSDTRNKGWIKVSALCG
jgi:hypothetical protein